MNGLIELPHVDLLGMWAATRTQRVRHHGCELEARPRFAFYGRVSTEDCPNPVSARRRLRTVAAILANPRYTGRQVWNRQHTNRQPTKNIVPGMADLRKMTASRQWGISDKPTHVVIRKEIATPQQNRNATNLIGRTVNVISTVTMAMPNR